jgi:hypothetical protein
LKLVTTACIQAWWVSPQLSTMMHPFPSAYSRYFAVGRVAASYAWLHQITPNYAFTQPSGLGQLLHPQAHQVGHEQEQSDAVGGEGARAQGELPDIGHRFHGGAGLLGAFFVPPPGQRSKPLGHGQKALSTERMHNPTNQHYQSTNERNFSSIL